MTLFSHEIRVVLCDQCGAPLEIALGGGSILCKYCNAHNLITARDESADIRAAEVAAASAIGESERIEQLRSQDTAVRPPPGTEPFLEGAELAAAHVDEAMAEWQASRKAVAGGGAFLEQERLFHLTLLLGRAVGDQRERALLETAVELLPDPRHRHILRCNLSQHAALANDSKAALEWLRPCQSRPLDLHMDTAYRIASAYLAVAQRDGARIRALLGVRRDEVPVIDGHRTEMDVLRAHGLENSDSVDRATSHLVTIVMKEPSTLGAVGDIVKAGTSIGLCAQSYPKAHEQAWTRVKHALVPKSPYPIGCIALVIAPAAIFLSVAVLTWVGILWPDEEKASRGMAMLSLIGVGLPGVVAFGMVRNRRRELCLVNHGRMALAQVRSCTTRILKKKGGDTTFQDLTLEIDDGGQRIVSTIAMVRDEAVSVGRYPCLFDEANPDNAVIQVDAVQ